MTTFFKHNLNCATITRATIRQGIPIACGVGSALLIKLIEIMTSASHDEIGFTHSHWITALTEAVIVLLTKAGVDYALDHCWPNHSLNERNSLLEYSSGSISSKYSAAFLRSRSNSTSSSDTTTKMENSKTENQDVISFTH